MERKIIEQLPFDEIYKDLLQPSMRKAGEALATVFDGANLILLPLKLLNEKSRIYFNKNIESYSTKINKVEDKTLIAVPQYVGLPVIDKLTYINQEDLSNAFVNLLVKASFEETLPFVHPAYIDILNRISADEAIILSHLKNDDNIPFINIYVNKDRKYNSTSGIDNLMERAEAISDTNCGEYEFVKHLTGIESKINLNYPNNINLYLENLLLNGFLYIKETHSKNDLHLYKNLESIYNKEIIKSKSAIKDAFKADEKYCANIVVGYHKFEFTELGKGFIRTCISDIIE